MKNIICLITIMMTCCFFASSSEALEPSQVAVVANKNCADSLDIAKFYCSKRQVPLSNIIELSLPWPAGDSISRDAYNTAIAAPIRVFLKSSDHAGNIKCLVTTWGIPTKVGAATPEPNSAPDLIALQALYDKKIEHLTKIISNLTAIGLSKPLAEVKTATLYSLYQQVLSQFNSAIARIEKMPAGKNRSALFIRWLDYYETVNGKAESLNTVITYGHLARPLTAKEKDFQNSIVQGYLTLVNQAKTENWPVSFKLKKGYYGSLEQLAGLKGLLVTLAEDIDALSMKDSHAAVDSELSMLLYDSYPLQKYIPNELKGRIFLTDDKVLMVSRLDGPSPSIAKELVTRAIAAEKNGVKGVAYFDLRVNFGSQDSQWPSLYDKSLSDAADYLRAIGFDVVVEKTSALFAPGSCPRTAIYCGWYSLQKYIPSSDFVTGAVGYHIASWEAIHLRDPQSTEWCPSMLKAGITATIGAVAEPYLHAFPLPSDFFTELLSDNCLVEAYYKTLPFNSWQIILIGDPLYKFKQKQ